MKKRLVPFGFTTSLVMTLGQLRVVNAEGQVPGLGPQGDNRPGIHVPGFGPDYVIPAPDTSSSSGGSPAYVPGLGPNQGNGSGGNHVPGLGPFNGQPVKAK